MMATPPFRVLPFVHITRILDFKLFNNYRGTLRLLGRKFLRLGRNLLESFSCKHNCQTTKPPHTYFGWYEVNWHKWKQLQKIVKFAASLNIDKIIFIGSRFKKCEVNFKNFYFFNNKTELHKSNLKLNEENILIKGSRSMRMETIINEL